MNKPKSHRAKGVIGLTLAAALLLSGCGPQYIMLHPVGPVGKEELHLIILSTILVLVVVIPVLILLGFIVWRYRDKPGNQAKYQPEWSDSKTLEVVWWGIPIIIIGVLGFFTAKTTFALTRPPEQNVQPVTIQVTSLNWKWLFQYPGQKVATVNTCYIPTGVPIQFELTADAPMNSFWVPQLGGQEYTMPGMAMRLWLQADKAGTYYGHGANFTGEGFAHDTFNVVAVPESKFQSWVQKVHQTAPALTMVGYQKLKQPGLATPMEYSGFPANLFNDTVWANGGRYMPGMVSSIESGAAKTVSKSSTAASGMNGMN